jgi:sterol desaturase/sphingolipid hydroxylase (fatty acid hydroxylase superfamily)
MEAWWLAHEGQWRLWLFAAMLLLVGVVETNSPALAPRDSMPRRWLYNLLLMVLGNMLARAVFPMMTVGWAFWLAQAGWEPLGDLPGWAAVAAAILAMDLAMYAQHAALHRLPLLWRLHRVHHSDLDYDCTTGLRFHPAEVVFTVGVLMAVIGMLGAPPLAVAGFELWLVVTTLFVHGNFHLPFRLHALLRHLIVTPDLHRVHHSATPWDYGSNFGNFFPWWDRLFGTYLERPRAAQADMRIGLPDLSRDRPLGFMELLLLPLRRPAVAVDASPKRDEAKHPQRS